MRIFRISNLLSLALATFLGVLLFWTSQAVQLKEDDLADVKGKLEHEQETLRVLSVEWDYLNRPQRLEKLATEQLGMQAPGAKEMVRTVNDIPEPIVVPNNPEFHNASLKPAPAPQAPKKETIAPATAEKQSFEKLIQDLDAEGGQ